jgi:hypothetical protein
MNMKSKPLLLALFGSGLFAAVAVAAIDSNPAPSSANAGGASPPTTQPAAAPEQRGPSRMGGGFGGRPFPVDPRQRSWRFTPTPEQVKEMEDFIRVNSPNRFQAYQNFNAGADPMGNMHDRLQHALVRGYLELRMLSEDSEIYDLKLQQIKAQDDIFGIVADMRKSGSRSASSQARAKLRRLEENLREVRKQEATLRVQRLSDALEREKQRLADLTASSPADVDAAVQEDLQYSGQILWGNPWGGGLGRGGPGFGRPFGGPPGGGPTTEPSRRGQ